MTLNPSPAKIIQSQAEAIIKKSKFWRSYIQGKRNTIIETPLPKNKFYMFEVTDFWSNIFSYIEWLGSFRYLRGDLGKENNAIPRFLQEVWGWPKDVSKVMWKAGRHPIAHVGQANSFFHYPGGMIQKQPAYVQFDINPWSKQALKDIKRINGIQGVSIIKAPEGFYEKTNAVNVTFFYLAIEPLLKILSDYVVENTKHLTNPKDIKSLINLNKQILH